jgi:hypothetical protein
VEHHHHLPKPSGGHWSLVLATVALLVGVVVLVLAIGKDDSRATPPQPTLPQGASVATVPAPTQKEASKVVKSKRKRPAGNRPAAAPAPAAPAKRSAFITEPPTGWIESFYPIYSEAQRVFGVNWLLIASVHRQETAFSTNITTYQGLNFAGCCGGPMQFNVTNGDAEGRGSTWDRYRFSYRQGKRPDRYLSMRKKHPSLYDDFDAIMAAGALLRDNGAGAALDASAWSAAYDYYGHDLNGISYASQVAARAIGWARRGFCATCVDPEALTAQVDAAWGAPIRSQMEAADEAKRQAERNATRR